MSTCERAARSACALGVGLALALTSGSAGAQDPQDQAAARVLFDDARALIAAGHYEPACPKLEAASKLYPGSGVLLNLGDCYEHVGRTASAWTEFREAASSAAAAGRAEDEAEARRRAAALEPKLVRVIIRVSKTVPFLAVTRDGRSLDQGSWGEPFPVDPGWHAVSAEAPDRQGWVTTFDASVAGQTVTVDVPELAPAPAPPTFAPSPAVSSSPAAMQTAHPDALATHGPYWTPRRNAGLGVASAGAVGVGVAGLMGLFAKSQFDTATTESGSQRHDDSVSAVNLGTAASVVAAVGAVAVAAGLVLWLTAPDDRARVGTTANGVVLGGVF
jgi:hypothetical protein